MKLYLVINDFYQGVENIIVNIVSNKKKAENLIEKYLNNGKLFGIHPSFTYHIREVDTTSGEIIWDAEEEDEIFEKEYNL